MIELFCLMYDYIKLHAKFVCLQFIITLASCIRRCLRNPVDIIREWIRANPDDNKTGVQEYVKCDKYTVYVYLIMIS